ncbi:hypothetical protein IWQ61_008790, partial [Dispira simplex]
MSQFSQAAPSPHTRINALLRRQAGGGATTPPGGLLATIVTGVTGTLQGLLGGPKPAGAAGANGQQ